jgi:hypothetical protein
MRSFSNLFVDAAPSLLRDVILVNIDIVTPSIESMIEYKRSVHK